MKIAALDLGTNTFLCLIAEVENQKIQKVICDLAEVVRLGQGMDKNRRFHPEALERAKKTLKHFRETIDSHGVEKVVAVATSASRDAENKEEFFKITEELKIPVEVIAGQREAELTYLGSTFDQSESDALGVIDVGGGSTELILKPTKNTKVIAHSLDIGAVRLTERHVNSHPISQGDQQNVLLDIQKNLDFYLEQVVGNQFKSDSALPRPIKRLIAVAGTPTTLAALMQSVEFAEEKIHGYEIHREHLGEWIQKLAQMPLEERLELKGMQKGREDVVVCGAMILHEALKRFDLPSMFVSTKGVRYGLALQDL